MASNLTNKNSKYINSLVSYLNDTKPYRCKLTDIVEEYQFYDTMNVTIEDATFTKIKIGPVLSAPFNFFSSGDLDYSANSVVDIKKLFTADRSIFPSNSSSSYPGALKAFRDEITDFAGLPFAYSKKSFDGNGIADVHIERNGDSTLREPLLEGHDYFQSHGAVQINIKQILDANLKFEPTWCESRDDNVIYETSKITRRLANDYANPISSIRQIESLLVQMRTGILNAIDSTPYDFNQFPFSEAPKEPGTNVPISGPLLEYTTNGLKLVDDLLAQIRVPQDYQSLYNSAIADGVAITPSNLTGYKLIVYLQERLSSLSAGSILLLNDLLAILDSEILPKDYEALLNILTNGDPGDVSALPICFPTAPVPIIPGYEAWLGSNPLLHPFDNTPSSYDFWAYDEDPFGYDNGSILVFDRFVDDRLSHLTPATYYFTFTDIAMRQSGKPVYNNVYSSFINIENIVSTSQSSVGCFWKIIATSNSEASYDVINNITGFIGSFTIIGTTVNFVSSEISFTASKISQPNIGQEVLIENSNKFIIGDSAQLETWDLIKVNPISYSRPVFNSNRFGYIKDLDNYKNRVTLLNDHFVPRPLSFADFVLTAIDSEYFNLTSPQLPYTALVQVNVLFNDGNLAFTIVSGSDATFKKGDKFIFKIENDPNPIQIHDFSLDYGYDLDSYDAQELVYNNTDSLNPDFNKKINFAFGSRFTDFDMSLMNIIPTSSTTHNRSWRLTAVPNLLKPIDTQKKDTTISNAVDLQDTLIGGDPLSSPLYAILGGPVPDLKLYYADEFLLEYSDDNFNTITSLGNIPVGSSFSDVGLGLSFDLVSADKPFVAAHSDDHTTGVVAGGDIFSFRIIKAENFIKEQVGGLISNYTPRAAIHGDAFHETISANWEIFFTSETAYTIVGYPLEGSSVNVSGTPLECSLSTSGILPNEGYSIDVLGLGLTLYPGSYGFKSGDKFTFTTYSKKPSILVHGSASGWQDPAIVGEPYWNGKIGFKIDLPKANLFNPQSKKYFLTNSDNSIALNNPIPEIQTYTAMMNIPYGNDSCQFVNAYIPSVFVKGVILRIHGGGWGSGNVLPWPSPTINEPSLIPVVESGFAVIDVNYRGKNNSDGSNGNGTFPNNVNDIITVLEYVTTTNIGASNSSDNRWQSLFELVNEKGFVVSGTSAGGHLAIMGVCTYGTSSQKWPKAVECIAGPLNLDYNNIFIDPQVIGIVIDPYMVGGDLASASPFSLYGTSTNPGPWFYAVNNSPCKFIFIHNENDTLVTNAMGKQTILNFQQFNVNTSATFISEGPAHEGFSGITPVNFLGNTPDNTTNTLPSSGNNIGDAWFADGLFWVYNNGTYAGDSKNPASINGFTRWFDHNYLGSETDYLISLGNQLFVIPLPTPVVVVDTPNTWVFGNGNIKVTRIRFDSPTIDYWLSPTPVGSNSPTGWLVSRSDIGVAGHLPLNGLFEDNYVSILASNMSPNDARVFQLCIKADEFEWWNSQDTVILHPSIDAKLPTANDFVLIDKVKKDFLEFSLSYGSVYPSSTPSLAPLAPVSIDPRFIDTVSSNPTSNIKATSPEVELLKNWIPFTTKEYDSTSSLAAFSDGATRIKLISAGSGQEIGTVVQHGLQYPWSAKLEWNIDFFTKYLPLNAEANVVVYSSGFNEKLNVRISESLNFLVDSGSLTTDFQFNDSISIHISEYHNWNIVEHASDMVNVLIEDSPFGGFAPGYDNLPYDFETQSGDINLSGGGSYDVGIPFTDYFYEARQLSGIDPLTPHQQTLSVDERNARLNVVLSQLSGFLNGTIGNTTLEYFLNQLDINAGPIDIATGFGVPLRGLGIEINIKAGEQPDNNFVGAGIVDALVLGSFDPASSFDRFGYDSDRFDFSGERTAILNTEFVSSIPSVIPPFTTYDDFDTPLEVIGFTARVFEFNFIITPSNILAIETMDPPLIYVWLPLALAPVQIPIVSKIGLGKYQVSLPFETEAKFYLINQN